MADEAEVRGVVSLNIDDAKAQMDSLVTYAEGKGDDLHGKLEAALSASVDSRGGGKIADIFGFGKAFKDNQVAMSNLAGWTKSMRQEFADTGKIGNAAYITVLDAIKQADAASKTYVDSLTAIKTTFGGISKATGIAGAAIVTGLVGLVTAASSDEDALSRLGQAMKATGSWSQVAQDNFEGQAEALLRLSGMDKTATIEAMSMGKAYGLTNDQITALLPHLADLQEGPLHIPLSTSFKLMTNALAGSTTMLARYGIHIKASADGTISFQAILNALSASSGQAEAAGKRLSGQLDILKGTSKELASSFGDQLIPEAQKLVTWAQKLVDEFAKLTPEEKKSAIKTAEWAAGILLATSYITGMVANLAKFLLAIQTLQASPAVAWLVRLLASLGIVSLGTAAAVVLPIAAIAALAYGDRANRNAVSAADTFFPSGIPSSVQGKTSNYYSNPDRLPVPTTITQGYGGDVGIHLGGEGTNIKQPTALSDEAKAANEDLTAKIFKLANTGLANSLQVLTLEAEKLRTIQGIDRSLVDKWETGQKALLIKEAKQGYKDELYAATHTSEETDLYNTRKRMDDMVAAGSMTKAQGNELYNIEAAKKKVSTKEFAPVSVEGTNVSPLMGFIASLQGGKEKKQTLLVDVKIDGKTIKVDTNSALSHENIEKIGRAVITQMMNNKSWSFAGG